MAASQSPAPAKPPRAGPAGVYSIRSVIADPGSEFPCFSIPCPPLPPPLQLSKRKVGLGSRDFFKCSKQNLCSFYWRESAGELKQPSRRHMLAPCMRNTRPLAQSRSTLHPHRPLEGPPSSAPSESAAWPWFSLLWFHVDEVTHLPPELWSTEHLQLGFYLCSQRKRWEPPVGVWKSASFPHVK